jgi:hypothetical protein
VAAARRYRRRVQQDCLAAGRPFPDGLAAKFWQDVVSHASPTTLLGAIALIEECIDGAEQPDVLENAIAFLKPIAADLDTALARAD